MQENIDIHNLFDQYTRDELSDNEKQEFEKRLETDQVFYNEFLLYKDIVTGIKIASEEHLREKFNQLDSDSSLTGKRVMAFMYLAAAVVLLAVVGTGVIIKINQKKHHDDLIAANEQSINNNDSDSVIKQTPDDDKTQIIPPDKSDNLLAMNLYNDNYSQYPNKIIPKSRGEVPVDSLPLAMYYYDNQDYKKSEELLNKLIISYPDNADINFYLAMSKMALPNNNGALELLLKLEKEKSAKYYFPSIWYSALLYLQMNETIRAEKQLLKLIVVSNPYKSSSAEILKLLKK